MGTVGRDVTEKVCFCARSKKEEVHSLLRAELIAICFGMEIVVTNSVKAI